MSEHISRRRLANAILQGSSDELHTLLQQCQLSTDDLPHDAVSMAALGGHDSTLSILLDFGLDVDCAGPFGTPVRVSSLMGHNSTVRILLERGARIDSDEELGTALQAAAMEGHAPIVQLLIQMGADVNKHSGLFGTALQAAAYQGHFDATKTLLDAFANMHFNGLCNDAFHAAAEAGHEDIVRLFLERGFRFFDPFGGMSSCCGMGNDSQYTNPLRQSSPSRVSTGTMGNGSKKEKGYLTDTSDPSEWKLRAMTTDYTTMSRVIDGSITLPFVAIPKSYETSDTWRSRDSKCALEAAAFNGHYNVAKLILDNRESISIKNTEMGVALQMAALNGYLDIVRLFTDRKLDLISHVDTAIDKAASRGHLEILDVLSDYVDSFSVARNQRGATSDQSSSDDVKSMHARYSRIVVEGSRGGHISIIIRGLESLGSACSVAELRSVHAKALTTAAAQGHANIVCFFLRSEITFRESDLSAAFKAACNDGHLAAVASFVEHDRYKLLRSEHYRSGLERGVTNGYTDMVSFILNNLPEHANVTIPDNYFLIASGNGYLAILHLLKGDAVEPNDSEQEKLDRALNIASYNGHVEVVRFLIELGANIDSIVDEVPEPASQRQQLIGFAGGNGNVRRSNALQSALCGGSKYAKKSPRHFWARGSTWKSAEETSHYYTIELLLDQGADLLELGGLQAYPLQSAVMYCNPQVVDMLIQKGADPNMYAFSSEHPLQTAAAREISGASIIRSLLKAGAKLPDNGSTLDGPLGVVLDFFGEEADMFRHGRSNSGNGKFVHMTSVSEILNNGPGAIVKMFLQRLPPQQTDARNYGLILQMAALAGDLDCLQLLLDGKIDTNATGGYYGTALQAAARVGDDRIIDLLIEYGADVNLLQGEHSTALRAAVVGGHVAAVELLLEHGADVDLRLPENTQPILHLAVKGSNVDIVRMLLDAGVELVSEDPEYPDALIAAVESGNIDVIRLLLDRGADVNVTGKKRHGWGSMQDDDSSPLHKACFIGRLDIVRLLLDRGANMEKDVEGNGTPLSVAATSNHVSIVRTLLEAGANIDSTKKHQLTALNCASRHGHYLVVEELLKSGATVFEPDRIANALGQACRQHKSAVVEMILKHLSTSNSKELVCSNAISVACETNDEPIFQQLLKQGVTASPSVFRQASAAGLTGGINTLLDFGIAVDCDTGHGVRALHVASANLQAGVVHLLLERGANVHFQCHKFGTPMMAALEGSITFQVARHPAERAKDLAKALPLANQSWFYMNHGGFRGSIGPREIKDCLRIIKLLIDYGADIQTKPRSFGNALHLASYQGNEATVSFLLDNGAEVNEICGFFDTPLMAALEGDHLGVVELLLDRGANVNHSSTEHGSPLQYACEHRGPRTVQLLLERGADKNSSGGKHGGPLAAAAASRYSGHSYRRGQNTDGPAQICRLLLQYGGRVDIKERDLVAAASHHSHTRDTSLLKVFLEYDITVPVTEKVLITVAKKFQSYTSFRITDFRDLLDRAGTGVTKGLFETIPEVELLRMFLQYNPRCDITPDILEAVACSATHHAKDATRLLLQHCPHPRITEKMIHAALNMYDSSGQQQGPANFVQQLLDLAPDLQITGAMVRLVKREDDLRVLLRRAPNMSISSKLLEEVSGQHSEGTRLAQILLDHDPTTEITPTVLGHCCRSGPKRTETAEYLFSRAPDVPVTPANFLHGLSVHGTPKEWLELLIKWGKKVQFTEAVESHIQKNYSTHATREIREMCNLVRA